MRFCTVHRHWTQPIRIYWMCDE